MNPRFASHELIRLSRSPWQRRHVGSVLEKLTSHLPESPPLYPADYLTDKPERFFAAEIIREQIFRLYAAEIPYSCEVVVTTFKDAKKILNIEASSPASAFAVSSL